MHANDTPSRSSRAEARFRDAFDRLKQGKPHLLPRNTSVSQNNVAKEAGLDPSALKKSRFPGLVAEIQAWISIHSTINTETHKPAVARRTDARSLRERLRAIEAQRDHLASLLLEADARTLELIMENQRLQALIPSAKVTKIDPSGERKPPVGQ